MAESQEPWLDRVIAKGISRKLTVFLMGTIFFSVAFLTAEQWLTLAVAYVGTQGFVDAVVAYKETV